MNNAFKQLIRSEKTKAKMVFIELIKPEDVIYKQLHKLDRDFISILINTMPDYFIDTVLNGTALDINDCNNFINTVYFNIYLSSIDKNKHTEIVKKMLRVFFDGIFDIIIMEVEKVELFSRERKVLESKRDEYYKMFENEVFLSSFNKEYKSYFELLIKRLNLENKINNIDDIYVVSDTIRPNNLIMDIGVIY